MEWFSAVSNNIPYAYIFLDALNTSERADVFEQLKKSNIPYEQYNTTFGSNSGERNRTVARIKLIHADALLKAGFEKAWHTFIPDALQNPAIVPSPPSAEALLNAHKAQWLPTSKGYNLFFAGNDYQSRHLLQSLLNQGGISSVTEDSDSPYGMGVRVLSHSKQKVVESFRHLLPSEPQLDYRLTLSGLIASKDNNNDIVLPSGSSSWAIKGKPAELEFLRIGLAEKGISAHHQAESLIIHPAYMQEFQNLVSECAAAKTRPLRIEDLTPPESPLSPPLQQAQRFNRHHLINTDEPILYGYKDGGRGVKFNEQGIPITQTNREIIIVRPPEQDPYLAQAIKEAQNRVSRLPTAREKITALHNLVAELLPENNPTRNEQRMAEMVGGDFVGKEICLGQLIQAETGVCRHRSLLFKVLADHAGIKTALVRGNFLSPFGSGGHAWNEAELEDGERLLVDVMHNKIATAQDDYVKFYADVQDNYLYRSEAKSQNPLIAQKGNIHNYKQEPHSPATIPLVVTPVKNAVIDVPVAHAAGNGTIPSPPETPREDKESAPIQPSAPKEKQEGEEPIKPQPENAQGDNGIAPPPHDEPHAGEKEKPKPAPQSPSGQQDTEQPHTNRNKIIFGSVATVIVAAIALILGKQLLGNSHAQQPAEGRGR